PRPPRRSTPPADSPAHRQRRRSTPDRTARSCHASRTQTTARTTDETDASPAPGADASQHPHHEQSTTRSNNASEQAVKGPKRHQAVSGYWHTHATLAGKPWLPVPVTA